MTTLTKSRIHECAIPLVMADKEATVYIVDVGRSMGKRRNGRDKSDLEWAMEYVWDKITTTVSTGRKTALVGVVGLGTDDTLNDLGEGYENISVLQPLAQVLMPDLRRLGGVIKAYRNDHRDAISALILAIQLIKKQCKKLKYTRRIILVTNGTGHMDAEENAMQEIIKEIHADEIELVVLGVDFDDSEYGYKEEGKSSIKAENEHVLRELVEQCKGTFGTMAEAIEELAMPRLATTRPVATFKGQLRLGNPEEYDTALCIDVERYPRTAVKKPPTASSFVLRSEGSFDPTSTSSALPLQQDAPAGSQAKDNNMTNVRYARTYQVDDKNGSGGKKDVDRDDLAKGYEYGRTAVHINESDENITKLETESGIEILGFIPYENVERYVIMDTSNIIVAQRTNDKAIIALSSLIHALYINQSCAIARVVKKDMSEPLLKLLSPSVEKTYECLIENELPFAEDVRSYRFPPLDKVVTVSGKIIRQHRNLPSDDLLDAMNDFVDRMDLSNYGEDDDGRPIEYMALDDVFSPLYHRIEQAKRWRAVHPKDPVQKIPEVLVKYSKPPEGLKANSHSALQRLIETADVKKVPPKVKGRKRHREMDKPLSGLNVEDLFRKEKRTNISPDNAIPEFKQRLATADDLDLIKDAVKQMTTIIKDQIRTSFGESAYDRAIEGLGIMRQEMVELEEPVLYNDVLRDLKEQIMGEELGGNRKEFWWYVRKNRLGLIDNRVANTSDVTEQEAAAFMTGN